AQHVRGLGREKLRVEIKAEELVAEIAPLLRPVPYHCTLCLHLERAGNSAYLNVGEGAALFKPKKKADKYDIARGEAKEVQKALRGLVLKGKLTEEDIAVAFDLADCIIGMLTNMIKNLEERF
ncbi:MAG: four helix bundle protein, partial [Gemmatimonadota bacterium]